MKVTEHDASEFEHVVLETRPLIRRLAWPALLLAVWLPTLYLLADALLA